MDAIFALPLSAGRQSIGTRIDAGDFEMESAMVAPSREVETIENPQFGVGHIAGHMARRLIDGSNLARTDPFIVMAEDIVPRDAFPQHPHRGIETVTLVLEGELEHFDSAGNRGKLKAGDAQWMTAGRGVDHEENPPPGANARAMQLWINLPAAEKMAEPRYQHLQRKDMPVRLEAGVSVRVLSGHSGDVRSPTLNHIPVTAIDAELEPGSEFEQQLDEDVAAFIVVVEGSARIGHAQRVVNAGEIAWLARSSNLEPSIVRIAAGNSRTRLFLFAAPPLREPIAIGGPFVMNTQEEVREAYADYRAGRFA